jgi:hypothetical protein
MPAQACTSSDPRVAVLDTGPAAIPNTLNGRSDFHGQTGGSTR